MFYTFSILIVSVMLQITLISNPDIDAFSAHNGNGKSSMFGAFYFMRKGKPGSTGKSYMEGYGIWAEMIRRCGCKKSHAYADYGGRGIKVCDRWLNSFYDFISDMGARPSKNHSIDRKNNDMNYSCGRCEQCLKNGWDFNCRWATMKEQCSNRKSNIWIEYNGEKMILSHWAAQLGIDHRLLWRMLKTKSFEDSYNYYKFNRRNPPIKKS